MYPPETDAGGQPPFKYPFAFAHKRIEAGGWTRQVTVRDFPLSKEMAGVEMRLISGGVRELHWHLSSEWAYMTAGSARITAVDQKGRAFVEDVKEGDLWLFPGGVPHSIQGLDEDGCQFLLVFDDGNFNEFETFLLTDGFTTRRRRCWRRPQRSSSRPLTMCRCGKCSSSGPTASSDGRGKEAGVRA